MIKHIKFGMLYQVLHMSIITAGVFSCSLCILVNDNFDNMFKVLLLKNTFISSLDISDELVV